jgi:hypothetical protein
MHEVSKRNLGNCLMEAVKNSIQKVGILTFHFSNHNYGAVLQAYASYIALKKLGYEPQIINLVPRSKLKQKIYSIIKRSGVFEKFRNRYLSLTEKFYPDSDLSTLNNMFDTFYVGSDQVWRPSMAGKLLQHYYLDFADDNKIKVAYAASFGTSHWEGSDETTEIIRPLIKRFDSISVRETEGVEICDKIFNVKATHALDPTLLLDENDYSTIFDKNKSNLFKRDKYIGIYLLRDRTCKTEVPLRATEQIGLPSVNLYGDTIDIVGLEIMRFRKVEKWLHGIKNASFIVTDSYHCMIFSIIFRKNFVCLPNERGGVARIKSLLRLLGLEDRYCDSKEPDFEFYSSKETDYDPVHERLKSLQDQSYVYLNKALTMNRY